MYIARIIKKRQRHFILRESCRIDNRLTFRNLFDLGTDPGLHIKYPGGNAFYIDENLEDHLVKAGADYDDDHLEDLFWPWLKPDIRRAVETFRGRSQRCRRGMSDKEKGQISADVHPFDKRRAHYLRFATMDQGPVENMPASLFKHLIDRCRDEIEQGFLRQEAALRLHELKSYVFTVFDLQSYFQSFMAKKMPHVLDQQKVDDYFIKELCRINQSFFNKTSRLDDYMIRYATMFFDHQYANTKLLDEMARDFIFRHHFHKPPVQEKSIPVRAALKIFKLSKNEVKKLTKSRLRRIYRKLARQMHPDTGGSDEKFVELNTAYNTLLKKIKDDK